MSETTLNCLRCNGKMIKGFNVDFSRRNRSPEFNYSYWVEGDPKKEKTIFGDDLDTLDLSGQKARIIRSLRCEKCGYLEHYAI